MLRKVYNYHAFLSRLTKRGVIIANRSIIEERLPFSYFIANKNQVIDNLKLKKLELNGKLFMCRDSEIPCIKEAIKCIDKAIKFNEALR